MDVKLFPDDIEEFLKEVSDVYGFSNFNAKMLFLSFTASLVGSRATLYLSDRSKKHCNLSFLFQVSSKVNSGFNSFYNYLLSFFNELQEKHYKTYQEVTHVEYKKKMKGYEKFLRDTGGGCLSVKPPVEPVFTPVHYGLSEVEEVISGHPCLYHCTEKPKRYIAKNEEYIDGCFRKNGIAYNSKRKRVTKMSGTFLIISDVIDIEKYMMKKDFAKNCFLYMPIISGSIAYKSGGIKDICDRYYDVVREFFFSIYESVQFRTFDFHIDPSVEQQIRDRCESFMNDLFVWDYCQEVYNICYRLIAICCFIEKRKNVNKRVAEKCCRLAIHICRLGADVFGENGATLFSR